MCIRDRSDSVSAKKVILLFAVLAILVGGGLSLYASANPDGLEWSVEKTAGMAELKEQGSVQKTLGAIQQKISILPDYDFKDGRGKGTSFAGCLLYTSVKLLMRFYDVNEGAIKVDGHDIRCLLYTSNIKLRMPRR